MDLTFTGRGLGVTDEVRETAEHKLAAISRLEPRATRIDLEFIAEHHPQLDGTTRVEAAVYVPAQDVPRRRRGRRCADRHSIAWSSASSGRSATTTASAGGGWPGRMH